MAVYHLQNYATYPVDQVCVPVSPSPIETKMYGRTYLPAPVQQCYCDTSHLVLPPALTVLGTRDIPLTPTKVSNPMSEKRVGKMLSCYTKKYVKCFFLQNYINYNTNVESFTCDEFVAL